MARNGTGTYSLIYDWEDDDANDIPIRSDRMQAQEQDIADALTQSLSKDGQTTPTANLPMGGFKLTGLGVGTVLTDSARLSQSQANTEGYAAASGTNTYTVTLSPAITAYVDGMSFKVKFANANTAAGPTVNFNGVGALNLVKGNNTALSVGDILANQTGFVIVVGSNAHWLPSMVTFGPFGLIDGGTLGQSSTAEVGYFYHIDCSASARNILLGSGSANTDRVGFAKHGTNTLTLELRGQRFAGSTSNPTTLDEGISNMIYSGSSLRGWLED